MVKQHGEAICIDSSLVWPTWFIHSQVSNQVSQWQGSPLAGTLFSHTSCRTQDTSIWSTSPGYSLKYLPLLSVVDLIAQSFAGLQLRLHSKKRHTSVSTWCSPAYLTVQERVLLVTQKLFTSLGIVIALIHTSPCHLSRTHSTLKVKTLWNDSLIAKGKQCWCEMNERSWDYLADGPRIIVVLGRIQNTLGWILSYYGYRSRQSTVNNYNLYWSTRASYRVSRRYSLFQTPIRDHSMLVMSNVTSKHLRDLVC